MKLDKNNISTIIVWISAIITPIIVEYGITIDQATVTAILWAIYLLIVTIYSSRNPNTMEILGNAPANIDSSEQVLNDEYEV